MCDDSPAERRYWMQKVAQLQKDLEQQDLARQRPPAAVPAKPAQPAAEEPQPLPV